MRLSIVCINDYQNIDRRVPRDPIFLGKVLEFRSREVLRKLIVHMLVLKLRPASMVQSIKLICSPLRELPRTSIAHRMQL